MSDSSFTLAFAHELRTSMPLRAPRVPVVGEVLVLGTERWRVETVEWVQDDDMASLRPHLNLTPTWGLRLDLMELDAKVASRNVEGGPAVAAREGASV